VASDLESRGWRILFHDVKVWRTQVDLIARSPNGVLTLIEVKSQSSTARAHLPHNQQRRLFNVAKLLAGYEPVELLLAFVQENHVEILPVDGFMGHW
jgi:Holliday junction resolvase-like predicted endonuclease